MKTLTDAARTELARTAAHGFATLNDSAALVELVDAKLVVVLGYAEDTGTVQRVNVKITERGMKSAAKARAAGLLAA